MNEYIIDCKSCSTHYIIKDGNGGEIFKAAKSCNTVESIKDYITKLDKKAVVNVEE